VSERDIDTSSENVLSDWARAAAEGEEQDAASAEADDGDPGDEHDAEDDGGPAWGTVGESMGVEGSEAVAEVPSGTGQVEETDVEEAEAPEELEPELSPGDVEATPFPVELSHEHAAGDLHIPDGYAVLEGSPDGGRRAVGIVVSRFNGDVTTKLLDRALEELAAAGVRQEAITVMVVPGAFELPLAATALAKTRRFACIVALGCIIRGDTPHFDYVAGETASGLQLAALETGVPVSFGVLTLDRVEQAEPRVEKGAEAVRSALEMADLFAHLRAAAAR
jgi:6,7-dimethyl-8-ribityllumazine synthase